MYGTQLTHFIKSTFGKPLDSNRRTFETLTFKEQVLKY